MEDIKDKEIEALIEKKKVESDALKKILKSIKTERSLSDKDKTKINK